jgi:hypothetical protein
MIVAMIVIMYLGLQLRKREHQNDHNEQRSRGKCEAVPRTDPSVIAGQGEVPVRNPVTTSIRNPKPSSSTADLRSVAVPSSLTNWGCTLRKL